MSLKHMISGQLINAIFHPILFKLKVICWVSIWYSLQKSTKGFGFELVRPSIIMIVSTKSNSLLKHFASYNISNKILIRF